MHRNLQTTPREDGLRWPAEWEPHRATWLAWPHNPDTWPGRLEEAEIAFVEMVRALEANEQVCVLVGSEAEEARVRSRLTKSGVGSGVAFHRVPNDDAWIRDTGPIFLEGPGARLAAVDFGFDSWGRKYPPWDRDAAVATAVSAARGVPRYQAGFVLEGGSVDGNGEGTVLTTTSCLLNPNRRSGEPKRGPDGVPGRRREEMEARLREWLCAEEVLWLGEGIEGDDTDGHIDGVARFVGPTTVVVAEEADASDPNHAVLAENLRRLRSMNDARGRRLSVVSLPMPPPVWEDGVRCPASYANFYLANGCVLVPVFDTLSDERALRILAELLPGREAVPIPARALVVGLGAVHCLTQQEPQVPTA